jgi:hypothetical protein
VKAYSVESFVHRQNLKLLKKQLEAPANEAQRKMLLRLFAEEEAKGEQLVGEGEAAVLDPGQCEAGAIR